MKLNLKQYKIIRMAIVILIAVVVGQAMVYEKYIIPIILLPIMSIIMIYLKKNTKGILTDERDYQIGGKAALWAIHIWSWLAVIAMFALFAFSYLSVVYKAIAMVLSFSVCILMLLYSFIFTYYYKLKLTDKKLIYIALVLAVLLLSCIAFLVRLPYSANYF